MAGVKPISSYPFLDIAKRHDIPYEFTLAMGQSLIHGTYPPREKVSLEIGWKLQQARPEIIAAAENFKAIVEQGWDQSNG